MEIGEVELAASSELSDDSVANGVPSSSGSENITIIVIEYCDFTTMGTQSTYHALIMAVELVKAFVPIMEMKFGSEIDTSKTRAPCMRIVSIFAPHAPTAIFSTLAPVLIIIHLFNMHESPTNELDRPVLAALNTTVLALDPSISYLPRYYLSPAKSEMDGAEKRSQPILPLSPEILLHIFQMRDNLHDSFWTNVTPPSELNTCLPCLGDLERNRGLGLSFWAKITMSPVSSLAFYNKILCCLKQSPLAITINRKIQNRSMDSLNQSVHDSTEYSRFIYKPSAFFSSTFSSSEHSAPAMIDIMLADTSLPE